MSLSSAFRLFSTKLPPSLPSSKPIYKNPPFLSPNFHPTPRSLSSKPHFKTPFYSSSSPPLSTQDLPQNLQSIIIQFQSVQNPRSKYEQLLFYGRNLPPLHARFKTVENKVQGCVSQVWVRAFLDPDRNVRLEADSDSLLTKGLAALLVEGLSGRPSAEIARVPLDFVQMLDLKQSLTPSRNNGFLNMLKLMQKKAIELDVETGDGWGSVNEGVSGVDNAGLGLNSGGVLMQKEVTEGVGDSASNAGSGFEGGTNKDLNREGNGIGETQSNFDGVDEIKLSSEVGLGSRGRAERVMKRLEKEMCPVELEVEDISYQHRGHAGVRGSNGETHFNLKIVSKEFEGKSLVKRHRIFYDLLQDELGSGLHALLMAVKTPSEAGGR